MKTVMEYNVEYFLRLKITRIACDDRIVSDRAAVGFSRNINKRERTKGNERIDSARVSAQMLLCERACTGLCVCVCVCLCRVWLASSTVCSLHFAIFQIERTGIEWSEGETDR